MDLVSYGRTGLGNEKTTRDLTRYVAIDNHTGKYIQLDLSHS